MRLDDSNGIKSTPNQAPRADANAATCRSKPMDAVLSPSVKPSVHGWKSRWNMNRRDLASNPEPVQSNSRRSACQVKEQSGNSPTKKKKKKKKQNGPIVQGVDTSTAELAVLISEVRYCRMGTL